MARSNKIKFVFILLSTSSLLFGQFQESRENTKIYQPVLNVAKGISNSLEWYDVPIYGAYLLRNGVNSSNFGNRIFITPSSLEKRFSDQFSNSSESLGSIDKDLIPDAIIYTRFTLTFGLDLLTDTDISSRSYQRIFLFKKSLVYTYVITEYVKSLVKRTRPDGSDNRSFFSGHTSTTFAAATYLYHEMHDAYNNWNYLDNKPLLKGIAETLTFGTFYGWASYVGYSRIHDRKHYLSDVVVGAIVGTTVSHLLYKGYFGNNDSFLNNFSLQTLGKDLALSFRLNLQ